MRVMRSSGERLSSIGPHRHRPIEEPRMPFALDPEGRWRPRAAVRGRRGRSAARRR